MKTRIPAVHRRARRGSTMLEVALSFMAFVLLTLGVMEFSMAVNGYNFVSYAAQRAARWASTQGSGSASPATNDSIQTLVRSWAIGLTSSNVTTTTTWTPTGDKDPGAQVTVVVNYTVTPLVGLALLESFNVSSTSQYYITH